MSRDCSNYGCVVCGEEAACLDKDGWCSSCIKMERETDWDAYEAAKRERIAESNEY